MVAQAEKRGQGGRRFVALLTALGILSGCSVLRALDFGGDAKKPFEFRFGWEKGIEKSTAKPGQVDPNGVYQPETPEVDAILSFPDVHAGIMAEVQPKGRFTPTVQIEAFEFKVPYVRWFSVQIGAGYQMVDAYVGKRLVSVFEITVGPWVGRDFEEDAWAWGVGGTLIKF